MEGVNESSGIRQHRKALFNGGDGLGPGQVAPLRCHQPCYRPRGTDILQLLIAGFFGVPLPCGHSVTLVESLELDDGDDFLSEH